MSVVPFHLSLPQLANGDLQEIASCFSVCPVYNKERRDHTLHASLLLIIVYRAFPLK